MKTAESYITTNHGWAVSNMRLGNDYLCELVVPRTHSLSLSSVSLISLTHFHHHHHHRHLAFKSRERIEDGTILTSSNGMAFLLSL